MIPSELHPFFVIGVILLLFFLIYKSIFRASVSFLIAIVILLVFGILESKEILLGFSNDKIASIILLILISAGLRKNFNIEYFFDRVFQKAKTYRGFLIQMMAQVAVMSAVVNNAPVVALMSPYVVGWGKRKGISPSKLLIPLSFATIMGGMLTVIGTSTTLLLNGFLTSNNISTIKPTDLLFIGALVTITGILFFVTIGHKLLPNRADLIDTFKQHEREYLVEVRLEDGSPLTGKTVQEANLRNMEGMFLVEISRANHIMSPVRPEEVLEEGDSLVFAGDTAKVMDLVGSDAGLSLPEQSGQLSKQFSLVECVLSNGSSISGKTIREAEFRNRYDAAVVAIHRNGERVGGRIGDIELSPGDVVLAIPGNGFAEKLDVLRDLFVISKTKKKSTNGVKKNLALVAMAGSIVALLAYGQLGLFPSLLIIFSIMIAFGLISARDIRRELDLNLVAILTLSLALGLAIIKTSTGEIMANFIIGLLEPYGLLSILIGLMLVANILTSLIGNVGAVSISFPLAYSLIASLNVDGNPFYLGVIFAASATFMTPFSYQTNLIVFGPGGYTFRDFLKVGVPVNLLYLVIAITGISLLYKDVLFV